MSFKSGLYMLRGRLAIPAQIRQFKEAVSHDKLSADEIRAMNWRKRLDMLRFAYENSPYYEKLYKEAGLEPGDVKTEDDWVKVPMLTREALRENFETIKVRHPQSTYKMYTTGGSTGQPSRVLKDDSFYSRGMNWRATSSWAGVPLGEDHAVIMRAHPHGLKGKIYAFAAHFPQKEIYLDADHMDEPTIREFVAKWKKANLYSISAYAGGAHELAMYCINHGIELPPLKGGIFITSSPSDAIQRKLMRDVFHAPVFDTYVATEAHPMANQCRHQAESGSMALHINSDYRHLEFVDEKGLPMPEGEVGDILVTDLGDHVFPFVRYRIGDRGRSLPGKCPCGLPYPLMDWVRGRMTDYLYTETGRCDGVGLTMAFEHCIDAVHGFQIHQLADKSVKLLVVPNKSCATADMEIEKAAKFLRDRFGSIPVTVEKVNSIPHDRGKLRYIVSDYKGD